MDLLIEHDRRVAVTALYQWGTYQEMLCGIPNAQLNAAIIASGQKQARGFFGREKVYLLEPYQAPIAVDTRMFERFPELMDSPLQALPAITCVASLSDPQKCTALTLLWYQSTYAFPIEPQVEAQLLTVPWSQLADFDDF